MASVYTSVYHVTQPIYKSSVLQYIHVTPQYEVIKMGKKTVSITLSKDVAKQIDDCANSMGMNRSAFMEWVFRSVLPTIPEVTSRLKQNFKQRVKEFWEWL